MPIPRYHDREAHMREIIRAVLDAAEPARSVELAVRQSPPRKPAPGKPLRVISVGKAAIGMERGLRRALAALEDWRGVQIETFFRMTTRGTPDARDLPGETIFGDHPIPSTHNEHAASDLERKVKALARTRAPSVPESLVLLVSGGASALLSLPVAGLTIDDLANITRGLLRAGADIEELNAVRKHCERLKGGRLAALASEAGAELDVYLISDVVGDSIETIGSGPASPDPTTFDQALESLRARGVDTAAPAVNAHLRRGAVGDVPETPKPGDPSVQGVRAMIVASNTGAVLAAEAAAARLGFSTERAPVSLGGEASDFGSTVLPRLVRPEQTGSHGRGARRTSPHAIILGGETTVSVSGDGTGGRNLELVLAAFAGTVTGGVDWLLFSFATDGVDGPTDAAGAWIDANAIARAKEMGLDPRDFLSRNDSYEFFRRLDRLIRIGPTGTNVNDVCVVLRYPMEWGR